MRTAFVRELEILMKNENTYLLTGDLGFSVFENIKEMHPDRYINMGVAEQSMLGMAAGMALTGRNVFVYSIIPFLIYRPFEQLRNDICYQNLPVRLVGVGAGFSYSDAGFTHHSIEDYGILCSLPNLTILSPSDPNEVAEQMRQLRSINGPSYMRLARNGEHVLHSKHNELRIGRALEICKGEDVLIISTGSILEKAIAVSKLLEDEGYSTTILDYHTLKPFDENSLIRHAQDKKLILTIEEHLIATGLYSITLQALSKSGIKSKVVPFGISEPYFHSYGTRDFMLRQYGIDTANIYKTARDTLKMHNHVRSS